MSIQQSMALDEPPYPSYEERKRNGEGVAFVDAIDRVYWPMEGSFPSNIAVLKECRGMQQPLEPFFRPDIGSDETGTWHEIALLSTITKKVSSIDASIREFDTWLSDWMHYHECHKEAVYVPWDDLPKEDRPYVSEADEDDENGYQPWEEDHIVRCCGEDLPRIDLPKTLTVRPSDGVDFVTVRDFVGGKSGRILPCSDVESVVPRY
jgi:hypothetical protein